MSEQVFDSAVDAALAPAAQPEAQPATGPSAVDSAVDSVLGPPPKDRTATAWRAQQLGTSPEAATQAVGLARQTGLDPTYTAQNLAAVQKQTDQRDMAAHLAEAPAMAAYGDRSAAHAASLSDSYREMSTLEWLITGKYEKVAGSGWDASYRMVAPPAPFTAFVQGLKDVEHAYYTGKKLLGFGSPEDEAEIQTLQREQAVDLGASSLGGKALVGGLRAAPFLGFAVGGSLLGGAVGATAAGGGAAAFYAQGVGPLYQRIKEEHPDIADEDAKVFAASGAGIAAALSEIPGLGFIKNLPGVKNLIGKVGETAVTKTLTEAGLKFVAQGGKHVVLGAATVAAQSAVNQATVELSGAPQDWSDASRAFDRVGDATWRGFQSGLVDMGALALLTPGRELLADVGRQQNARLERARLTAMEEVAKTAKLAQRAPAEAEQALAGAAGQPGADSTVYIDHEALSKNPEALAAVTQAVGQAAVDEAAATKGDVAVPIEKYLTQLVADGHAEKLRDDVKLSADGWTQRQADEWAEAWHGTPHTVAKFDMSKIGTGQGAATYGHGMYFAEAKDTAEFYRSTLSEEPAITSKAGPIPAPLLDQMKAIAHGAQTREPAEVLKRTRAVLENIIASTERAREIRLNEPPQGEQLSVEQYDDRLFEMRARLEALNRLKPQHLQVVTSGNVYRAAVPAKDALLDYDKSISQQPPRILAALEEAGILPKGVARYAELYQEARTPEVDALMTPEMNESGVKLPNGARIPLFRHQGGEILYRSLVERYGGDTAKASEVLRDAGIPGLKYQDAGSREGGEQTHNFVIWDESKMRILTEGEPLPGTKTEPVLPPAKVLRQYAEGMAAKKAIGDLNPGARKQQERRATEKITALAQELAAGRGPGTTETRVITPQSAQGEPAHYDVVEAKDLITSHKATTFAPDARYPAGVQERDYQNQPEEQRKVMLGGQNIDPDLVLANAPTAVDGPPLVTTGGKALVLGGNGRSMMLQRAYAEGTGEAYRKALIEKAEQFGLDSSAIEKMKQPVLVRRVDSLSSTSPHPELVAAVRRFNEGLTQQLSPRLRAVAESRVLSPNTIASVGDLLSSSPDSTLRDLLRSDPQAFVRILERDGVINEQNRAQWTAGTELTDEAKDRIEGMFLGRVMGSGERLGATAPSLTAKVERAVPQLLRVAGANPAYDQIGNVQGAIDLLNEAARHNINLDALLKQQTLFKKREVNPRTIAMAHLLDEHSAREIAARFKAWADDAAFDPRQATMFQKPPTEQDATGKLFAGMDVDTSGASRPADAVEAAKEQQAAAPAAEKPGKPTPSKEAGPSKAQQLTELENARTMARHMAAAEEATKKKADAEVTYLTSRGGDAQQAIFARAPAAYREAADSILSAVGLGGKATDGAMDTLLARMKADLAQPLFNVDALRALIAKPIEVHRLTLGEVQNVANAIRQIRYVARRSTEVSIGGIGGGKAPPPGAGGAGAGQPPEPPREPLQAVIDRLRQESKDLPDQPLIPSDEATVGTLRKLDNVVSGGQAALRAPERLWAKFGETGQSIFEGYVQRRNYRDSLDALVTKYYAEHWDEKMPDEVKARRYDILDLSGLPMPEGMDPTRSRTWLMKLMLHMGNAGNRMRTLEGYGWTFDQVMGEAGKHLNRDELGFIQSIWDFNEQHLKPLIWEQEKRLEGEEPKTVEPMPFTVTLADGSKVEMQGGYFPLKKDLRPGVQPEPSPAGPARFLTPDYQSASTSHSYTEDRAERAKYIVNLQWNDVPGHIQQVIHDLAFREYTMDVARLLDDPGFQQVAVQKQGTAAYNALVSDLYVMANGRAEYTAQNMNKIVGAVRSRVATASVVGSVPVLMGQFLHPFIAMASGEIPVGAGMRAFVQGFSPSIREEARLVFPEVQHRYQTNQANYRQMLGNIGPRGNVGPVGRFAEQVRVIAHGMQQAVDDIVTTQIALASHSELTGQGLSGEEAVTKAGQTVRRLMPTHDIAEQSALLRDRGVIGSLLMFHGFMNKLYNITADRGLSAQASYRQGDWAGIARNTGQVLGMLAVAGLGRYIMGHGAKDDEDAATFAQKEALLMPSELLPFGREIMQPFVDSMLTDKTLAQSLKHADIRFPALGYYLQQAKSIGTLVDENAENEDKVTAAIDLALAGLKLPRQPLRTGKYLYDVATDRERPQGPFDFGAGLAYGTRPNQPSNPGRDLQAALR